jgi:hypothetical protein
MTAQEKGIIETILADVGLEPLFVEDHDRESKKNEKELLK